MTGGRRDVEADLRRQLATSARQFLILIDRRQTTATGAVLQLAKESFNDPARLRDGVALLDEQADADAVALLTRATRYAEDPPGPAVPPRLAPPDAGYFTGA